MTGQEIIEWIQENGAEDAVIYVALGSNLFKTSDGFEVLGSEDCPCMQMIVIR